jgi:hypothetical protein
VLDQSIIAAAITTPGPPLARWSGRYHGGAIGWSVGRFWGAEHSQNHCRMLTGPASNNDDCSVGRSFTCRFAVQASYHHRLALEPFHWYDDLRRSERGHVLNGLGRGHWNNMSSALVKWKNGGGDSVDPMQSWRATRTDNGMNWVAVD